MANVVFASNSISHFPTAISGINTERYDSTRVRYSIDVEKKEILNSPEFNPVSGEDTWFHFNLYFGEFQSFETQPLLQSFDENNNLLFAIRKQRSNDLNLEGFFYNDSSVINGVTTTSPTRQKINTIDVHLKQNVIKHELKLYINRFLALTLTINDPDSNRGKPIKFELGQAYGETRFDDETTSTDFKQSISEIIIADEDTRNARLNVLLPSSTGSNTSWSGNLTELSDDDTTSGMTALEGGLRHSYNLSDYTGASNISNVVVVSTTTRGPNSPTKLKHTLRVSGIDYDSDEIELGFPLQYNITDWKINPATSQAWVDTDLDNLEAGILSVT